MPFFKKNRYRARSKFIKNIWIKKSRKEEMTGLEIRALFVSAALTNFKWFCEYFNVKRTLRVVLHTPAFNGLVDLSP